MVAIALALHVFDLAHFSWPWIIPIPRRLVQSQDESLGKAVKDGRVATDFLIWYSRRRLDDIGTFDSLILARPYRALLDLSQAPLGTNLQIVNSALLAQPALRGRSAVSPATRRSRFAGCAGGQRR